MPLPPTRMDETMPEAIDAMRRVDHSALRTNQAFIITLLIGAFILDAPLVVAFVAAVMAVGSALPQFSLFKAIYARILKPLKWVKPDVKADNPEPHRFAQMVGATVLVAALLLFALAVPVVAWGLVWLVVALAALNLFAGVCVGCLMYYGLHRLGIRGFDRAPIQA